MLLEAEFWVAVAFVLFMAVVWKVGGFDQITKGLDGRAKRVRHELDEARRLREEAAGVLADYKKRRTQAEVQATAQVRAAAADAAVKVSEVILRERMQGDAAQDLVRRSLGEVRTRLQA